MRYDTEHKQKTRRRLLTVAAQQIRAEGPDRIGISAIMAKAGLTHGGFYAHFSSKDELVAEAISEMFADSHRRLETETKDRSPTDGILAYINFYLSAAHRDARAHGCPISALTSDIPRMSSAARQAFAAGSRRLQSALGDQLAAAGYSDVNALSASVMAELVGALSIARAEPTKARSDALLAASRHYLRERLGLGNLPEMDGSTPKSVIEFN
ncbi:TetR family transcriptional regulator [Pseudomonas aeruginosa]|uniref:TetR/AcrR family transcriptional regulator n=1 Tax=Pseudomonas aeruginosa TaxID=287 RepID=UPI0008FB228B|nr:TetR/AcrR family transcriptional regulator [Pseudomonas aeruginosa]OPD98444.1 TetR family transcriptional regulator [Pseudomonas aeruginosa]